MNMLVSGGAGFIGSHLVSTLLEMGHRVICVDNLYLGKIENIQPLLEHPHFHYYREDLNDLENLSHIFEKENIDYVFHLAANSDIQASAKKPIIEWNHTLQTTFNLLECMRKFNVKKLFFASTSAVYGEKEGSVLTEETTALNPISYYGGAKLGAEAFIKAFSHMNDLDVLIFRFPNVVGSRLTHGVIYDFINRLQKDPSQLTILGDGTQCKPYMHVSDLIAGIILLKDAVQGVCVYNIGVETETSVTQIADIICETMGLKEVNYHYTGGKIGWKGDVPRFQYDLHKIYATGWKATMCSEESIRKAVQENL